MEFKAKHKLKSANKLGIILVMMKPPLFLLISKIKDPINALIAVYKVMLSPNVIVSYI